MISAGKANDPAYLKHYLRSFPGHVPDAVEKFMKDKSYSYQDLSIAQLHQCIMETWQEHCLSKRVEKDFKRHQDMFTPSFCKNNPQMPDWGCDAHNHGHLQSSCKCHGKKKPKGFHTSEPRYHYPEKPLQFSRKQKAYPRKAKHFAKPIKFLKRRSSQATKKNCFLCGQPDHWASKCPKKKSKPRLAAFCDNLDSRW